MLSGGDGCIAGLSNFAPEVAAGYAAAARAGDLAAMRAAQQRIDALMAIYDVAPQFVPTIKAGDGRARRADAAVLRPADAARHRRRARNHPRHPAGGRAAVTPRRKRL